MVDEEPDPLRALIEGVCEIPTVLRETFRGLEARKAGTDDAIKYRYPSIDDFTNGLHRGELVVVAGAPSMGASTLAVNLMRNVCLGLPGLPPAHGAVFFSLETSRVQLVSNFLCSMAKVDTHRLRGGFMSREEEQNLLDWGEVLEKQQAYVVDGARQSISAIRSKIEALVEKRLVDCVFVDCLQLVEREARQATWSKHEVLADASSELKRIARDMNVAIVLVSKLNRTTIDNRATRRPDMSLLPAGLDQDADVVILIHRDEYYMKREQAEAENAINKAQIFVQKNRHGPIGQAELYYAKEYAYFGELQR